MKLEERIKSRLPFLNERERRLFLGMEARKCRRGGIRQVSRISGVSEKTIRRGIRELEAGAPLKQERVRKVGGGRKPCRDDGEKTTSLVYRLMEGETIAYTVLGKEAIVRRLEEEYNYKTNSIAVERAIRRLGCANRLSAVSCCGSQDKTPSVTRQLAYIDSKATEFRRKGEPVIYISAGPVPNGAKGIFPQEKGNNKDPNDKICIDIQRKLKKLEQGQAFTPRAFEQKISYVRASSENIRNPGALIEAIAAWYDVVGARSFPNAHRLFVICDLPASLGENKLWIYHLFQMAIAKEMEIYVSFMPCGRYRWFWRHESHQMYQIGSQKEIPCMVNAMVTTVVPFRVGSRLLGRYCRTSSDVFWLYKISQNVFDTVELRKSSFCKRLNFSIHGFKWTVALAISQAEEEQRRRRR